MYARRRELREHTQAVAALRRLAEGNALFGLPVFCVAEFVRIVTHRRLFDPPTRVADAFGFIGALLESPNARLLLPGERFFALFSQMSAAADTSGNLLFDAQIAALCVESGVNEIVTNDRDFSRFPELRIRPLQ